MNKIIWGAVAVILLSACSKNLLLFNNNPDRFNLNNLTFETLVIKTKIKVNHDGESLKATANIRIKKDSIIWFSLTPGLGIEAARGIITRDSIVVLDKINKVYDIINFEELSKEMHFDFDYHLIESILIGNLIWSIAQDDYVAHADGLYSVLKTKGPISIISYIGDNSNKLEKIEAKDMESANAMDVAYTNFKEVSEKIFPTDVIIQINYKRKRDNTQKSSNITIQHNKIEIDKKNIRFNFKIPSKYEHK